jgi:hypothetical protein
MKLPYTVILLYPDFLSDNYGEETYVAWVEAESPEEAVKLGQKQVLNANANPEGCRAIDFYPIFACEGHHRDLSWSAK